MKIDIITLFPDMFQGPFNESILRRAQDKSLVEINLHNLRKWAIDERGTVDDRPYGGGTGMLLRPEPVFNAVKSILDARRTIQVERKENNSKFVPRASKIVLLDAGGSLYTQQKAIEYSQLEHMVLICGHYEGVDYRVHEHLANDVISIGDFVLTGGELPAIVLVDSIVRLIPGVLEKENATQIESFSGNSNQLVEFPQYTRPEDFNGYKVPEILLSGHHGQIETWRNEQARERTRKNRPDLLTERE